MHPNGPITCSCFPLFQGKCKCHIQELVCFTQFGIFFSFLKIKFQNDTSLKKQLFLTYFSYFWSPGEKKKSFNTYPTFIPTNTLLTLLIVLLSQFYKKWLMVLILFWVILGQSKKYENGDQNLLECLLLISTYTNGQFIVICKPTIMEKNVDTHYLI